MSDISPALALALEVYGWCLRHDQPVPDPVRQLIPVEQIEEVCAKHGVDTDSETFTTWAGKPRAVYERGRWHLE